MPTSARRIGLRVRNVDTTVDGSPESPTRVPRRVCKGCDGESVTLSKEYGLPRTSKVASVVSAYGLVLESVHNSPGLDADTESALTFMALEGVEGVCCIEIYL